MYWTEEMEYERKIQRERQQMQKKNQEKTIVILVNSLCKRFYKICVLQNEI